MIGEPKPLSTGQALGYFLQESQGIVQLVEHEDFLPEFGGALLERLGLKPGPFTLEQYEDFILGDFPALKDGRLKLARAYGDVLNMTRAAYEVMVSMPKSVSMQVLMSGDTRLHEVVKKANSEAMKKFADYCIVRVTGADGIVRKHLAVGIAFATWWHITTRERDEDQAAGIEGAANPQLHAHNIVHRLVLPYGFEELVDFAGKDIQIAKQMMDAVEATS